MTAKARPRSCAMLAFAVLAVTACNSSDDTSQESTTTPASGQASTTAATTEGQASTTTSATHGPANSVPGLDESALAVMDQPQFDHGRWSISVRDIDTGETLVDLDADKMAEPGSAVKSYSMGAGWLEWGPDHRIVTPVKRTGEIVDGTLQGDLVLVGKGDITMGGRTKPDGSVDFTNLDHNDANPLPGATLTPEDPLAGLDAAGRPGEAVRDQRGQRTGHRRRPPVPVRARRASRSPRSSSTRTSSTSRPRRRRSGRPPTIEMRPRVSPWTVTSEVRPWPREATPQSGSARRRRARSCCRARSPPIATRCSRCTPSRTPRPSPAPRSSKPSAAPE